MKSTRSVFARIASIALCSTSLFLASSIDVFASSTGISARTVEGCSCHLNQSDATLITLSSESGQLVVEPGGTLTLTLAVAHENKSAAGVDIAVTGGDNMRAGMLNPIEGQGLMRASGELVHTSPKSFVDGKATFAFTWTAPSVAGTYTLRAAANAVNGNGNTSGDEYNLFSQTITVGAVTDVREGVARSNANLQSMEVFPNPVQAHTAVVGVRYTLANGQNVTVDVYDAQGRIVLAIPAAYKTAGEHAMELDTRTMASGMYIAIVRAGNERLVQHITVAK